MNILKLLDEVASCITIAIDRSKLLKKQGNHAEIILADQRLQQLKMVYSCYCNDMYFTYFMFLFVLFVNFFNFFFFLFFLHFFIFFSFFFFF